MPCYIFAKQQSHEREAFIIQTAIKANYQKYFTGLLSIYRSE